MSDKIWLQRCEQVKSALKTIKEETITDLTYLGAAWIQCGILHNGKEYWFCWIKLERDFLKIETFDTKKIVVPELWYDGLLSSDILRETLQTLRTAYLAAHPDIKVVQSAQWQAIEARIDRILAQLHT